ncbi:MAG: hypothetical protein J7641_09665 [Cyanobacteria bacterium SID2]|nr:hypothetical protein [Cyanobacteria bacterium SID2]MBP0002172.1 hypothetical protein [Cyanobacteria bacterium SBC]
MICKLVESALQTGCLSVASEASISQFLRYKAYRITDLDALQRLRMAIEEGQIDREAPRQFALFPQLTTLYVPVSIVR